MNRIALLLSCLLSLVAGAQTERPDAGPASVPTPTSSPTTSGEPAAGTQAPATTGPSTVAEVCRDDDDTPEGQLGTLQLRIDGQIQTLSGLDWKGLQRLTVDQVRTLTGLPETGPLTVEQATRGLRRLARTELFARITPTLRLAEGSAPSLEVALEEHPFITSISFQGPRDVTPRELREEMFRTWTWPPPGRLPDEDDEEVVLRITDRSLTVNVTPVTPLCPPPRPPREWLARLDERGELLPGIIPGGLKAALERALDELRDDGYLLASIAATLHPDGRLEVEVDEGRIEGVDVEGVDADMVPRVREALGLQPGDTFLRSDASQAVRRLEKTLPFLRVSTVERPSEEVQLVEEKAEDGTRRYRTLRQERQEPRSKRRREHAEFNWEELAEAWWNDWGEHGTSSGLVTRGRRVVVGVRARRPDFELDLLPVHTQVTGLAPGLEGALQLWDPRDRAHLTLETALFLPWRLGGQRIPEDPEQTRRQRRLNWLMGAKGRVPSLGLAELGGQFHDFTDTLDRWRMGAIDSFLYSALLNRPDADYFRRKGAAAFATWRLGSHWLLGGEYRRDTYATLVSLSPPLSLFRRDSPAFPNAPATEGRFASVIARLEYASDGTQREELGSLFRSPELSLLSHEDDWPRRPTLRSFATVEVGNPSLGGDEGTRFWKLVSDTVLYVPTGHDESLRLRLRAAGGEDLPLQKLEGLGGWSALRGYGFKELRGDASVLASAEYRWEALGAFVDVGSVRQEEGWTDAKLGLGASLHLGDEVELTAAWRLDDRADWVPEARLLFTRPF
ncbi:BamA/TamA family outer membrane protein [Hyalangium gracile]|uniref:hypothetical protein n=1 Tax=Hyalangium gracile TaxID=394092 RepID=UPI001CC9042C|nr:hypothetical protein [Hyalangium gracile]